jgi:hypothetical protein
MTDGRQEQFDEWRTRRPVRISRRLHAYPNGLVMHVTRRSGQRDELRRASRVNHGAVRGARAQAAGEIMTIPRATGAVGRAQSAFGAV